MQKVDALRHDIRKAEKLRRELESRIEEAIAEATKERKLRERSEEYCRQMQVESDRLRVRSDIGSRDQQDAQRLKAELEKLEVLYLLQFFGFLKLISFSAPIQRRSYTATGKV